MRESELIWFGCGNELDIHVPPDSARIREYLAFFPALLTRQFLLDS